MTVLLSLSLPLFAQHGSTTAVNPYTGPDHARAGAKLFRTQCASCHGLDGTGTGAGPSLTSGSFRRGGSDEALFQTINKGVPGTSMPAFAFTGLQIWQLVTHIRSLVIERGAAQSHGDAQAGAAVFKASCAGCHTAGGAGGYRGPDLTGIALRRSEGEIRTAILSPDTEVPAEFWAITVTTAKGETVRGTRLNEDTESVQLRDGRGRLISLRRTDIANADVSRKSPMPAFKDKLTDTQLTDVVAWLRSQKEEQ